MRDTTESDDFSDSKSELEPESSGGSSTDEDGAFEDQDWYNGDSDTSEDIPDPNLDVKALYQDFDKLPKTLQNKHFKEGLLYSLILNTKKTITFLGMVILVKKKNFVFRIFGSQGSAAKTFHEGSSDKEFDYADV